MTRALLRAAILLSICILSCFTASAQGQYVLIGEPDDSTWIDTSFQPIIPGKDIPPTPNALFSFSSVPVSSVNVSQIDCSQFPQICMYVDVLSTSGIPLGGMTADSFCVNEDGTAISGFTVQQLRLDSCITAICLVVDVSGSMGDNGKLDSAKSAMHRFVNNMDAYDRVAIVPYSDCIGTITPFTSNKTTLHNAINALHANGFTACFDGIYKGVDLTKLELGSKAVIAFTDGLENRSQYCSQPPDGVSDYSYRDDSTLICNLANGAGVPIYTFNLGTIEYQWYNPYALQAFSAATGGAWGHAPSGADIDSLYSKIKARLCSRYYICYNSIDTVQNGDIHASVVCYKHDGICSPCDTAYCQEAAPPVPHRTPTTVELSDTCQTSTTNLNICTYVYDIDTPVDSLTVRLFYRLTGSASYTGVDMTHSPGDSLFCYAVPFSELTCKSQLDYYFAASDGQHNVSDPPTNPQTNPYVIQICPDQPPPVANAGRDTTVFQCSPAQICIAAGCTDPNSNLVSCQLISGTGTFDGSNICFAPSSSGTYTFILKATDACGAIDYDTSIATVSLNQPPVANAGRDTTLFQCTLAPISIAAGCSDPDGNLSTCLLVAGPGSYSGGFITFTPSAAGTFTFVLKATDACGAIDYDTSIATVSLNQPPVANAGRDTTLFQCALAPISIAAGCSDPDGNLSTCQLVSGPGSYSGGFITFTPAAAGTFTFVLKATDACGAIDYDTSIATVSLNQPPVANAGRDTTLFQCALAPVSIAAGCSDPDGNLSTCQLVSGPGSYSGGFITFTPSAAGTYTFILKATDACGAIDYDTSIATVSLNQPPVANAGRDTTLFQCALAPISITAGCSDPDGNLSTCQLVAGPGSYSGGFITFTPAAAGTFTFVLQATDVCGAIDYDTSVATVSLNQPPVANAGRDTTLFQCSLAPISIAAGCSDPDGNLSTCQLVAGPGSYSGGFITFTPAAAGTFTFVLKATDACGAIDYDTSIATVSLNQPPVANAGRDTTLFQCSLAPISIAAGCSDPDGNLSTCLLVAGPGSYSGGFITFTPAAAGTFTFVLKATDACGAIDYDTSIATVSLNQPPVANAGRDTTLFQCALAPISIAAGCSDPDGNLSTCQLVSGPGSYSGGFITFTPAAAGTFTFVLKATDVCGATDYDTSIATVSLNQPPVANAGRDTTLFQCALAPVSIAAGCSDPDGNLSTCQLVSGPGSYSGGFITFTPSAAGTYTFILKATDVCGAIDYDTSIATVSLNQPPVANAGRDTTLFQCALAPISIAAGCSDPDGNLTTCQLVSGPGSYSGGFITFTPSAAGIYTFILKATDACGAIDYDTSIATVSLNQPPVANAGRDTTLFQCALAPISIAAGCSDPDGNLSTCQLVAGPGSYSGGFITFTPSAAGTYTFILKATDVCGAIDYDTSIATVNLNQPPVANAGRDTTLFQCSLAPVSIAAGCSDPDGNLSTCQLVAGPGSYSGGFITFTPSAAGTYTFVLQATDACGLTDLDTSVANVTVNQLPVANAGRDTTVFQCAPAQICIAAGCSDPDGNLSTCQLVSGPGTLNGGGICFTPTGSGAYTFVVKATDACGAIDYDTSVATATINQLPVANAGRDTTVFQCSPAQICIAAGCSDPDNNLTSCQLVAGPGALNGGGICFTPTGAGSYTFVVKATDACGAIDYDTSVATVTINQPPVANAGRDTTLFQCAAAPISIVAGCSDPDGNLSNCQLISGIGSYSGGLITFAPTATGSYTFILQATDACGLTDVDTAVANVTLNQLPVAFAGRDTTLFLCASSQICILASCSDPDGNLSTCQLVSGPGTYSGGQICFSPTASGAYTFILKATDACGATDYDTSIANITMNQPPVANAGRDTTAFQCTPAQICIAAGCSDPDNNLLTCQLVSGPGTLNGGGICFTPTGSGTYTFVVKATDACGATDYDTSIATVTINQPPIANAGRDTTLFLCSPIQVCIAANCSDPDNNLSTCQLISGAGTLNGGGICFTPTASGTYTFIVKATDACGLTDYDTSVAVITINQPPVANAGTKLTLTCFTPGQQVCWAAGCTDPDNNLTNCQLVSGVGTYSGGQICFTPPASGSYTFVLKATDACNAVDYDTVVIDAQLNVPPILTIAATDTSIFCLQTGAGQSCMPFSYTDENIKTIVATGSVPATVTYGNGTGLLCFTPATSGGSYTFTLTATDSCNLQATAQHRHDVVLVDCDTATCFVTKIEKTHNSLQGHAEYVSVTLSGEGAMLGGFDFLFAYDASALTVMEVVPGQLLINCGWEYLTYRFGATGNCDGPCPSGLLRVVGLAETNNGPNHPTCFGPAISVPQSLFEIKFFVTNDRTYECQYVPVRFYWMDCGDNAISSVTGDTLYLDKRIYSFEGNMLWDELDDDAYPDYSRPFGMGAWDDCLLGDKYHPIRCIEFWEGGIDIVCADSIDARGDLNLNGMANEIADAVLYTNYFLYGIVAFPTLGREGAIAASDVNADGRTLTVGDLVYLIRIITGDALPYAKLSPFGQDVSVRFDGQTVATEANVNIGALLLTFKTGDEVKVTNLTNLTLIQNQTADELKVLVYDMSTKSLGSGLREVVRVEGKVELVSAEVADYSGNMLTAKITEALLPKAFALGQNYPNPFNPETVIEFALPTTADVSLRVYNIAGQLVKTLVNGTTPAGYYQVRWDGRDERGANVSSGVYFYKIDGSNFSETRKMVLIK